MLTRKIGFLTAFILPLLVVAGAYLGGMWNFLAVGFAFVVIPVLDWLTGLDRANVDEADRLEVSSDWYYRIVTMAWAWFQPLFLGWCLLFVWTSSLVMIEWIGFVIGVGLVTGGIGITVAHELGHRTSRVERFYSQLLLLTVCYPHFFIEHNRGHHIRVATPDDPATARKGEVFYAFWFRTVIGGYVSAWKLEASRLQRQSKSIFSLHNKMVVYSILVLMLLALVFVLFSTKVFLFFLAQSFVAVTLLELVNYVEHYGLLRANVDGVWERVNPLHSWNASHQVSNLFLFQLQRHSDHHMHANKRYQVLDHLEESPQLPYGYPTMVLMALVPPLWFRIVDVRLLEWQGEMGRTA